MKRLDPGLPEEWEHLRLWDAFREWCVPEIGDRLGLNLRDPKLVKDPETGSYLEGAAWVGEEHIGNFEIIVLHAGEDGHVGFSFALFSSFTLEAESEKTR